MDADEIYEIRERIQQSYALGDKLTDSRLATHYTMITACTSILLDKVPNPWISKDDTWEYLQEALLPEVSNRQVKLTVKPKTLEHLLGVVVHLVDDKHATLTLPEVLIVVNPHIRFAPCRGMSLIKGVAVSLKLFLKLLEKHGIEHPEEKIIRRQLSSMHDSTTRSKSFFLKPNMNLRRIDRSTASRASMVPLTCVCLSQGCIARETLKVLIDINDDDEYGKDASIDTNEDPTHSMPGNVLNSRLKIQFN